MNRMTAVELELLNQVLKESFHTSKNGFMTARFEKELCLATGATYSLAMCNGTATLHTCLAAAGIGRGDEVITTPLTMSATTFAIMQSGAIPIYADVNPKTWTLDARSVEARITKKTRAVIAVSLYGHCIDFRLKALCEHYKIVLIEDAAQRLPGPTIADMASYSYQASKHLTSGEGGAITTNSEELADNLRRFATLGYAGVSAKQGRISRADIQNPDYDRHVAMGYNYRMSDLCAAVLVGQMQRRDELAGWRKKAACMLRKIDSKMWTPQADEPTHSYWSFAAALHPSVDWKFFYDLFVSRGGDPPYAAWKLTFDEPFFKGIAHDLCPVASKLQKRIVAFCLTHLDYEPIAAQANIISSVLKSVDNA